MPDQKPAEPIVVNANAHAAQVVRPPATVPQAPRNPAAPRYVAAAQQTVALAPNQQGDAVEKQVENGYYCPLYGVTSFAEWEALQATQQRTYEVQELTGEFTCMVGNIMADPQILNKDLALNRLMNEFTARLNEVKRAKSKPGVFQNLYQMLTGKAKTVEPSPEDQPVTQDELRKAAKEAPFQIWQTKEGTYRWFAIYSNNFRDQDHPPEIISEASHKNFIELVNKGVVPYPELWHWHVDGSAWGKADILDYVEGFALAAGYVYPGHEDEAKALADMDDIRVSHGMPSRFIVRNPSDPSIIEFHVTSEISPLPGWAAANPLTEFVVL